MNRWAIRRAPARRSISEHCSVAPAPWLGTVVGTDPHCLHVPIPRGRLLHGRHFTYKSITGDMAITFVSTGVEGAFATEEHPYAAHGPWLQVRSSFSSLFFSFHPSLAACPPSQELPVVPMLSWELPLGYRGCVYRCCCPHSSGALPGHWEPRREK